MILDLALLVPLREPEDLLDLAEHGLLAPAVVQVELVPDEALLVLGALQVPDGEGADAAAVLALAPAVPEGGAVAQVVGPGALNDNCTYEDDEQ